MFKIQVIRRKLRIWSHLLNKSLMENLIFFTVSSRHFERQRDLLLGIFNKSSKQIISRTADTAAFA